MRQVVLENIKQKNSKSNHNYIKINKLDFRDVALLVFAFFIISLTVYAYMIESEFFTHLIGATSIIVLIIFIKTLGSIKSEKPSRNE